MMMNPNLILQAGQGADILGSMQRGNALAGQVNDQRRQNALAGFMQENGAALMQGDQNALAQYAQFDPQAAIGMADRQQERAWRAEDRAYGRERDAASDARQDRQFQMQQDRFSKADERADQEWQWKVAEYAAQKSEAEREAEAAQIEGAVKMGLAAQSPEQWDQIVTQAGAADLVGQFENRQAITQQYMSVADILKGQHPATPLSPQGKFNADQKAGIIAPDAVYQPGGNTTVNVNNKPLTEAEGRNTGFLIRAQESGGILDNMEVQGTNLKDRLSSSVPIVGNYMVSDDYQKFDQAKRDFVNAILRRESGAVISPQEFDNADKQYFPQPGDSEQVIAQKRANRGTATSGLRVGSGRGVDLPEAASNSQQQGDLAVGTVEDGFRYLGGEPGDPASWEQVQ